jgi:hypothetical protein
MLHLPARLLPRPINCGSAGESFEPPELRQKEEQAPERGSAFVGVAEETVGARRLRCPGHVRRFRRIVGNDGFPSSMQASLKRRPDTRWCP